jgi:hypothetical protein
VLAHGPRQQPAAENNVTRTKAMQRQVPEADWKVFRKLREIALERFCRRVLDGLDRFRQDDSRTYHERYLELFRWLQDRDDDIARAFNDPRRSRMLLQLATIVTLDVVKPEELAQFTPATRKIVEELVKPASG